MLPFMVIGLIRSFRFTDRQRYLLLYIFVGIYTVIHLLSWALIRYRLPVDAILIIFAAPILISFGQWILRHASFLSTEKTE